MDCSQNPLPPNPKKTLNPCAPPYYKATSNQFPPPTVVQQVIPRAQVASPLPYRASPAAVSCYDIKKQPEPAKKFGFYRKKVISGSGRRSLAPPRLRLHGKGDGESGVYVREGRQLTGFEKKPETKKTAGDGGCRGDALDFPVAGSDGVAEITSLMIRNIPNHFRRRDLLRILDTHCLLENEEAKARGDSMRSAYDFFYLPMDFRRHANLGYAFVNFTSPVAASRFRKAFQNYDWKMVPSTKICAIAGAKIQGKDALLNHFKSSIFPCHTNAYLPVLFSPPRDGEIRSRLTLIGKRWNGNR